MKILLVANMYSITAIPELRRLRQNTEAILKNEGFTVDRVVLQKKTSKLAKLIGYASYYTKMVLKGLTGKYDFIYVHYAAHNAMPLLLLKKLKPSVKIVTNVHGSDVVPEVPSQEKFQPNVKKLLHNSTIIITPSHYYETLVKEKYGVTTPIRVFPSGGVNAEVFHPDDKQERLRKLNLDPAYRYIGYVGRLDVGKGWDHYIKAVKLYLDEKPEEREKTRFIVVGSGKDDDKFTTIMKELKLEDVIIRFPALETTTTSGRV